MTEEMNRQQSLVRRGTFHSFFVAEDGKTTYFGGIEEFNDLFETDSLPKDVLEQNPDLPTFSGYSTGSLARTR